MYEICPVILRKLFYGKDLYLKCCLADLKSEINIWRNNNRERGCWVAYKCCSVCDPWGQGLGLGSHLLPPIRSLRVVIRVVISVWIWVIIQGRPTALGSRNSVLNKSNPTNRIGRCKMIFPSFNSFLIGSLISDEICFSPKGHHLFFRHVRFNI